MRFLEKVVEWSMRVCGMIMLLATVVAFFAMFWKGLYCLGVAIVSFIVSQICFVNAEQTKEMFDSVKEEAE